MPKLAFSKMTAVYYESKLKEYEDKIEQFNLNILSTEINWELAENYINEEGIYVFGGFN